MESDEKWIVELYNRRKSLCVWAELSNKVKLYIAIQFPTSKRTQSVSIIISNHLFLFRQITAVVSDSHKKHMDSPC
jgi:hypothetical protein